jgi:seryl-tRNA synthetase
MLSIDLIRREPDLVRQALEARGETDPLGEILELDAQRRRAVTEGDDLRAERNRVSRALGQARASGEEPSQETVEEMRRVRERVDRLEQQARELEEGINTILLGLPNIPLPDVPPGEGEEENVVVRRWGEPRRFDFTPLPHWELGESLGLIDFQRGVKLSGSRFFTMFGRGAKLERALISWMLDLHTEEHGYTEVMVPHLVKREAMEGSGNLPKFSDNLYHDEEDDLWLVPTAEVPITNLHRDEVLSSGELPRNYVAYTPCFRREKAAAGRDTRGIKRVHQFDKVEMYKLVTPEASADELEKLVADAEDVCQRLGLPYRVLQLCAGDLGFPSAMTYDIEAWASGCQEWLEVSSCSNCTDFQARRAHIRYRPGRDARPQLVHTLNGSGLALPRVVIAILENYQQADGSVVIPEVLRPYTGFDVIPAGSNG